MQSSDENRVVHSDLCYVFDECYDFEITQQQLTLTQKWSPADGSNPPLAAAVAFVKAQDFIATMPSGDCYWALEKLSLFPVDPLGVPPDQA
jgi:hypothetical protein